jgi:hypothetical protein
MATAVFRDEQRRPCGARAPDLWNAAHARSPSRFNIFKWETRQLAPFERRT